MGKIRKRRKQFGRKPGLARLSAACLALFLSACASEQKDRISDPPSREPTAFERQRPALGSPTSILDGARASELDGARASEVAPPTQLQEGIIFRGTGFFVRDVDGSQEADGVPGDVTLNFVDANIVDVVRAVLGDALKLSYTIDPQVRGRMTLQTATPITRDAILPTLEAALELNGVALLRSASGLYAVMPIAAAQSRPGVPQIGGVGQGFGLQIVQLKYVSAANMQEILSAVAPQGGVVYVDRRRNLLILSGTRQDTRMLIDTINLFDVDYLKSASYGVFRPTHVRVSVLIRELEQVFEDSPLAGLIKLIPLERINAVLAIAREPGLLDDLQEWIRRLDVEGDGPERRRIFLYHVQNAKARDLAATLRNAFGLRGDRPASPIALDTVQRALSNAAPDPAAAATTPSEPGPDPSNRAANAEGAVPNADRGVSDLTVTSPGGMRIIADQKQNLLIIFATQREYRLIEDALKNIDFAPDQVLIEATIAEVDLTDDFKLGIQWSFDGSDGSVRFTDDVEGAIVSRFPGFSAAYLASDVRAVLNALSKRTDVNVISSPKIVVLDNQPAMLEVGDEVPIATQSAVSVDDPNSPIVNSIELRQTGVILQVTPRINKSGLVILEIAQEVSDVVATTTSDIDSPTIQQRRITSTVAVQSGATVALGGLIRNNVTRGRTGVPILKDIPVLGALFRAQDDMQRRTELLVFLTPRIIRNPTDAIAMTAYLREQLSNADFTEIHGADFSDMSDTNFPGMSDADFSDIFEESWRGAR